MVSSIIRGLLLKLKKKKIITLKHSSDNIYIYKNKKIKKIKI